MSSEGAPDISDSATKLNATIGVAAFVLIFGCVGFFIALDICLRIVTRRHTGIIPTGRRAGNEQTPHVNLLNKGLDKAVIDSLPVFIYSSAAEKEKDGATDCPVCLCEFEEQERGRLLPKCKHKFHADCIDMWFQSHSTCPICRSSVVDGSSSTTSPENAVVVTVQDGPLHPPSGSSAQSEDGALSSESSPHPQPAVDPSTSSPAPPHLTIDISKVGNQSQEQQQEFKSPVAATLGRLRSLRRMLSSSSSSRREVVVVSEQQAV